MDLEGYESESMLAHKHTEVCERIVKMGEGRMKTMFKNIIKSGFFLNFQSMKRYPWMRQEFSSLGIHNPGGLHKLQKGLHAT